jgi:mannose-1-phosphate guanylyltransferase
MMGYLAKDFPNEPVAILWSDHFVRHEKKFKQILLSAGNLVKKDNEKIIFIGQKPRFASDNLGWIETYEVILKDGDINFSKFAGFKYKPDKDLAEEYFKDKKYCWNLGYFVSTPKFIYSLFQRFSPNIYNLIEKILVSSSSPDFESIFKEQYHQMPEINFDSAILEQLDKNFAYVVIEDIGWSDVGAWEALKEALEQRREDNVIRGNTSLEGCVDNLIYNYNDKKLVVGIDLENMLVVDTPDVLLVAKKTSVAKIKKLVESFKGTENERLT